MKSQLSAVEFNEQFCSQYTIHRPIEGPQDFYTITNSSKQLCGLLQDEKKGALIETLLTKIMYKSEFTKFLNKQGNISIKTPTKEEEEKLPAFSPEKVAEKPITNINSISRPRVPSIHLNDSNLDEFIEQSFRPLFENRGGTISSLDRRRASDNTYPIDHYPTKAVSFKKEDSTAIMMCEVGYTNANSNKPILGTYGAGPCVAIAIYNPATKTAALAHIAPLTILDSINPVFAQLSNNYKDTLEVHLAGGNNGTIEMVERLQDLISRKDNVKIVPSDLIHENCPEGKSLAIDARTGEIFTGAGYNQLDHGKDLDLRMKLSRVLYAPIPLIEVYDGRSTELAKSAETSQQNTSHGKISPRGSYLEEATKTSDTGTQKTQHR